MSEEQFIDTLPRFEAKVSKDFPEFLLVYCPREDCPGTLGDRPFLVHKRTWLRPVKRWIKNKEKSIHITGRSCPYCFRPARLPRRGSM